MSFGKGASCASGTSAALPAKNGLDQAKLAGLLSVGAEVTAARALRSAGSSGLEGGAAASTRAALYPGEEASRRRPVTPGPAGPYGLQPRHSLAPLQRPLSRPTCRGPPRSHQPENETATSASPCQNTYTNIRLFCRLSRLSRCLNIDFKDNVLHNLYVSKQKEPILTAGKRH